MVVCLEIFLHPYIVDKVFLNRKPLSQGILSSVICILELQDNINFQREDLIIELRPSVCLVGAHYNCQQDRPIGLKFAIW